jgi:ABC-2 type transport system ATP-binding protein
VATIEIRGLRKRFGSVEAVKDLSFDVEAGRVTGFLGPNGAGKSTTLRALLGLIHPTAGTATFGGRRYDELERPSAEVGAVLEDASFHPGRSARNHLRVLAAAGQHPEGRVDQVLEEVGLSDDAGRRVKGYSMGMRQRLAIAAALLGDPRVLILDEPTNGLDPPGIAWMRGLLRDQAGKGRAVLVSSHLLAEVAQSVDDVVVIARGELRGRGTLQEVLGAGEEAVTEVRAQDPARMAQVLQTRGFWGETVGDTLLVRGATPEQVGITAHEEGLVLFGLAPRARSLESAFFSLTADQPAPPPPPSGAPR